MATKVTLKIGDLTKISIDVIVNAANASLMGGGGVDGAIHKAGGSTILAECIQIISKIGSCQTGQAVITNAGNLPCKKVIHTVGPVWRGGTQNEHKLLATCYQNSMALAIENNLSSIAFPTISTGIYHFPKKEAARLAVDTVSNFLNENPGKIKEVVFVCFDEENLTLYQQILATQKM
ncbi:MAG: O-acetyl-ADP-ribose deacetylase [Chitinophagaceae bacterium]|nr:O-acetyl-ADP-ribose deacetylase [Chitinophagaceae bacterium]